MKDDNVIICRCEDVTLGRIRELINEGYTTLEEVKRIARCGMGPCQGNTCTPLIAREIARMTGKPMDEIIKQNKRPPFGGITFEEIVSGADEE
jgi:NAD(P)H-nitrite reductase large subunit